MRKALVELKTNPLYSDYMYYPFGVSLVFHTMTFLNGLLSIPLQSVFGLTGAQNFLNIFTFVLSAYGTFLLVNYLVNDKKAAFISGCILAFCPYRLMTAMGFYHLLNTQWIPFYVLSLLKLTREAKWSHSVWAGVFLLLTALNSYNYVVFLGMFTVIYLLYFMFAERKLIDTAFWKKFALGIGIFLLGFTPVLYQAYREIALYGDYVSSEIIGTDLLLFFIPSIFHPLFGKMALTLSSNLTSYLSFTTVFLGYSVLALSLYAVVCLKKQHRSMIRFWLLCGGIFFAFSLGPYLQINGRNVFHIGNFNVSIPLPHQLLLKIPVLGGARVSGRFSVMLILSLAVLSGYTCSFLFKRVTFSRNPLSAWILAGIVFIGVMFEYFTFPYPHLYAQSIPKIYHRISQESGDFSILQIPLQFKSGGKVLAIGTSELDLCQVVHQKRLIGGYVARIPEQVMTYFSQIPILKRLLQIQEGQRLSQERIEQDKQYADNFINFFQLKQAPDTLLKIVP